MEKQMRKIEVHLTKNQYDRLEKVAEIYMTTPEKLLQMTADYLTETPTAACKNFEDYRAIHPF